MERKVDSDDIDYRAESNRVTNEPRRETDSVNSIGKFEIRENLPQEENTQEELRDTWTGKFDFFLSALSLSGTSLIIIKKKKKLVFDKKYMN